MKDKDIRWVYNEQIELWAPNKEQAQLILNNHGFTNIDPKKLKEVSKYPQDIHPIEKELL